MIYVFPNKQSIDVVASLIEDTFTIDEVAEMLDGLLVVVVGEMETELINTAHTNILLLRQLFQQAEKWHLKLAADISELENRWVGMATGGSAWQQVVRHGNDFWPRHVTYSM